MIDFLHILPNWTLEIEEVSNNAYKFVARNENGTKTEIIESDYDYGYLKCLEGSFDIEMQLNNDNKFLYATFLKLIDSKIIKEKRYDHFAFGSWCIQSEKKRIVLDGKDNIISIEILIKNDWISTNSISLQNNIKIDNIVKIINEFK